MKTLWRRRVGLLGVLCALPWVTADAQAGGHFQRDSVVAPTSYAIPTAYYEAVPTSYALTTSFLVPAVYADPIAYISTSYVTSPTSYVVPSVYATSYVLSPRRYARRPVYVSRSYVM